MSGRRFRRARPRAWLMAGCLALAGCASLPGPETRPALPEAQRAQAEAAQAVREAALRQRPDWRMSGRVALSNGRQGGSGRIEWQGDVEGRRYQVALSAPVTRQSWRLRGGDDGAVLEGLDGGPRAGSDAAALLREATGWEIPVRALSAWMVGARAPEDFGEARLAFAADGRLAGIAQGGWTVEYGDWRAGAFAGVEAMPGRIEARRGEARVRLVVDDWSQAEPSAPTSSTADAAQNAAR